MNKKAAYRSGILMILLYLFISTNMMFAGGINNSRYLLSDDELKWKVVNLGGNVDFRYTPEVKTYIKSYIKQGRKGAERILGVIPVYFPVFEKMIQEKNLPSELKVLAIVESHLRINAYSKAGAAGLWQFISGTARQYDLTVSNNYDERYSVEKATNSALDFLNDLHIEFDDWTLALAAYNCGAGNVRKAIRRSGGKTSFWDIKKYLPRETQKYIPKFIAITYLLEHYKEHGMIPEIPNKIYFETADAKIYKHLSFKKISDITGVPFKIIKNMNCAYRRNYIPVNTRGYKLTLPKDALYKLLEFEQYDNVEFLKENTFNYSKYINSKFSREVALHLLGGNYRMEIISITPIRIENIFNKYEFNRVVNIPKIKIKPLYKPVSKYFFYHILKPGESLVEVAQNYENMDLRDILRWNEISITSPPKAGTKIRVSRE